jgi:ribulose bisphosphate carboxylase small subunit
MPSRLIWFSHLQCRNLTLRYTTLLSTLGSPSNLQLQRKTPPLLSYEDKALYSTWNISLDHVKQSEPAAKLLQLWAYFSNQDVWLTLELLQECQDNGPGEFLR